MEIIKKESAYYNECRDKERKILTLLLNHDEEEYSTADANEFIDDVNNGNQPITQEFYDEILSLFYETYDEEHAKLISEERIDPNDSDSGMTIAFVRTLYSKLGNLTNTEKAKHVVTSYMYNCFDQITQDEAFEILDEPGFFLAQPTRLRTWLAERLKIGPKSDTKQVLSAIEANSPLTESFDKVFKQKENVSFSQKNWVKNIKNWLTEGDGNRPISRESAIKLCFVFSLSSVPIDKDKIDDVTFLLRNVLGLDVLHTTVLTEFIYSSCLSLGLSYERACDLIEKYQVPFTPEPLKPGEKIDLYENKDTHNTESINTSIMNKYILQFKNEKELIAFLDASIAKKPFQKGGNTAYNGFAENLELSKITMSRSNSQITVEPYVYTYDIECKNGTDYFKFSDRSTSRERLFLLIYGEIADDDDTLTAQIYSSLTDQVNTTKSLITELNDSCGLTLPDFDAFGRILRRKSPVSRELYILSLLSRIQSSVDELDDLNGILACNLFDGIAYLTLRIEEAGFSPLDPRKRFDWLLINALRGYVEEYENISKDGSFPITIKFLEMAKGYTQRTGSIKHSRK